MDIDVKNDTNNERNEETTSIKPFSTLQCLPLKVASIFYSFMPIKECLEADKCGNRFLLTSAIKYLDKFEALKVTYDMTDMKKANYIQCKRITQNIAHLQFTDINRADFASEMVRNMLTFARSLEYI